MEQPKFLLKKKKQSARLWQSTTSLLTQLRDEWLAVIAALGIESLSPSEHRDRIDRLERAIGAVVMFTAQLRLADQLGVSAEWRKFVNVAEIEGED